jgi:regulator of RNase E activity RraA
MALDESLHRKLTSTSTATLSTILLKRGYRNSWMKRLRPAGPPGPVVAGEAFTIRYIPGREDLTKPESWMPVKSTRVAVEEIPPGSFIVIDAMRCTDVGIFGDIVLTRILKKGAVGLVTDGIFRDLDGCIATGLPLWCDSVRGTPAPSAAAFTTVAGWQEPVACGEAAVFPGDVVVADSDGVVVVPRDVAEEVADAALATDDVESWTKGEVERGEPLVGLYPMNEAARERYEKSRAERR